MAIPPDIRIRLEQLRGEMAAKAEAQRRQQQAQANAEKMSKQFVPGKAKGGPTSDDLKRFLAESKVKSRMYHGTSADISRFKPKSGDPVFLSPDPSFASKFALDDMLYGASSSATGPVKSGANVMPVYAQAKNPFDYENPKHIRSVLSRLDPRDRKAFKEGAAKGLWQEIEKHLGSIQDSGFDAVYLNEMGRKNLAVFDPSKIKSATGNRGTYDTSDPDITKAGGGRVLPKDQHDENLKRFLAESAIKQRMYTGTSKDKDFSKFNVPRNGAWFTPSTEVASSYAKENDSKDLKYDFDTRRYKEINTADRVMPVYLRATKPYQITADDIKSMRADNYKKAQSQFFDKLRAKGHDSVVYEDGTTVILEGPHQIKSAIGNRGTYDPTNPDITKAKGGEVNTPSLDAMKLALTQKGGVLPKEEHDENLRNFLEKSHIKDRLYHATPENFSEFKPGGKDPTLSGPAIWLSPDPTHQPAAHNVWGGSRGFKEGTNVMPVHVQTKNPLILDDETMIEWAREVFADGSREFPDLLAPKTVEEIKKEGYDSIIHADPYKTGRPHEVIMFDPNKIKSATANRGTFDTSTPDITKAEGGKVQPSVAQMKLALNQQGMYSPLEKAAMSIPRTKGTPAEFMAEISKQPGFRKDEVEDRKISLPEGKMTKQEFLEHVQKNHPSPRLDEKVYRDDSEDEDGDSEGRTQYEQYQLPGGQNYREVLLKTPTFSPAKDRQIMELESNIRRMNPDDYPPGYVQNMIDGVNKLKAEKAAMGTPYQSSHWMDDPNVLAHMRLSDRYVGDTGRFTVMGTKNGKTRLLFQTGINGTPEQAQEAAKRWQDQGYETSINQVGGGKKLLHIEEIQSDWHQQGRKEGYKGELPSNVRLEKKNDGYVYVLNQGEWLNDPKPTPEEAKAEALEGYGSTYSQNAVPDAPFKKNWHELALKHAIGIAAREGYDGIVITPGQQQADRYDLSKHIDELHYNPDLGTLVGNKDRQGKLYERGVTPDKLESYVGKEVAAKIMAQEPNEGGMRSLVGQQLTVGGEGMKGFYDKIVPTYLNKLGKPHGVQVQMNAVPLTGTINIDDYVHPSETADVARIKSQSMHYFPITDSMRQQIKNEGLPQYEQGGKVKGLDHFFESDNSLDHFFQE